MPREYHVLTRKKDEKIVNDIRNTIRELILQASRTGKGIYSGRSANIACFSRNIGALFGNRALDPLQYLRLNPYHVNRESQKIFQEFNKKARISEHISFELRKSIDSKKISLHLRCKTHNVLRTFLVVPSITITLFGKVTGIKNKKELTKRFDEFYHLLEEYIRSMSLKSRSVNSNGDYIGCILQIRSPYFRGTAGQNVINARNTSNPQNNQTANTQLNNAEQLNYVDVLGYMSDSDEESPETENNFNNVTTTNVRVNSFNKRKRVTVIESDSEDENESTVATKQYKSKEFISSSDESENSNMESSSDSQSSTFVRLKSKDRLRTRKDQSYLLVVENISDDETENTNSYKPTSSIEDISDSEFEPGKAIVIPASRILKFSKKKNTLELNTNVNSATNTQTNLSSFSVPANSQSYNIGTESSSAQQKAPGTKSFTLKSDAGKVIEEINHLQRLLDSMPRYHASR